MIYIHVQYLFSSITYSIIIYRKYPNFTAFFLVTHCISVNCLTRVLKVLNIYNILSISRLKF